MITSTEKSNAPKHIAIILDGNGRWAENRELSRTEGHIEGVRRVEEIVDTANAMGVGVLTLFTFSTENWVRPESEVDTIMALLTAVLKRKLAKLKRDNIRFSIIGQQKRIPSKLMKVITEVIEETKDNTGLNLNLAFNYGSRVEIIDAVKEICQKVKDNDISLEDINEDLMSQSLYTKNLPDPDLLIRTSGEKRISNFLLWQLSYAELYFSDKLWPEFTEDDFKQAISDFQRRERRFGDVAAKG